MKLRANSKISETTRRRSTRYVGARLHHYYETIRLRPEVLPDKTGQDHPLVHYCRLRERTLIKWNPRLRLPIYYVDAFAEKLFQGNPAAVVTVTESLDTTTMQSIAFENNLSETAFVLVATMPFLIRWFSPLVEVDLCGHATLASARILFDNHLPPNSSRVNFSAKRGSLSAFKRDDLIYLDFPVENPATEKKNKNLAQALGAEPIELYKGQDDFLAVFESEKAIHAIDPDFSLLAKLECRGVIVTAPGDQVDFVSRFFAPRTGVPEDPVTGSTHTFMVPYWARKTGKTEFTAAQLSQRSGRLYCELSGSRVFIGGHTKKYLQGEISI